MIAHVEGFRFFHANLGVKYAMGGRVVGFEGNADRRLRMAHFFEGGNHGNGLLSIEKETASFGFGSGCSNRTNGLAENVNSTVGYGFRRVACGTW